MWSSLAARFADLPGTLLPHVQLTAIALLAGIALSVPTAIVLSRFKRLRYPVLTAAGAIQTVPALALLALMVPVLAWASGPMNQAIGAKVFSGFGFWPAVIALSLYAILPILRNSVTGILGVDPAVIEAARGVGMTPMQSLSRVELPLAMPVIVAGVRTATVWTVGMATLATPVGQSCLGDYIFTGLQTNNTVMVVFGVVVAACLALGLDALIGTLQRGVETRRWKLARRSGVALAVVLSIGLASPWLTPLLRGSAGEVDRASTPGVAQAIKSLGRIEVGGKNFNEQYVLVDVIERRLRDVGFAVRAARNLGTSVAFDNLSVGDLDVYVDYSGTIWADLMKRRDAPGRAELLDAVAYWTASERGVRLLGPMGFENAYCFAMRRDRAEALGVTSIADLADHDDQLILGGDLDYFEGLEWAATREGYGLGFADTRAFAPTLMYDALQSGEVDVITAYSSDGRIAAHDLVVLDDPRQTIPPYDAVLLLGPRVADSPGLVETLRPLIGAVTQKRMVRANEQVDVEGREVADAAAWLYGQVFGEPDPPADAAEDFPAEPPPSVPGG